VSSMGPVVGDVNRDGLLAIFIPNLNYCILFIQGRSNGQVSFSDQTAATGLSQVLGQYAGWGAVMFDYDNDGWLDIFTVHGDAHHEFVQENTLMRNKGNGTFEDVSDVSGQHFKEKYVGRGAAWADFDNDGDIDLVISNLNDRPILLRNDGGNKVNNWLTIEARLQFPSGTRDAIGTRIIVSAAGAKQIEDLIPSRGYMSQGDPRLHFGLGKAQAASLVEVRWPDGNVEKFENVKANQFLKLVHKMSATGVKR
jgi:hypothetical protein